jgi:hypothetical protein
VDGFAGLLVSGTDDVGLADPRVGGEHALDGTGVADLGVDQDDVARATGQVEHAVGVEMAEVAGADPAIA